ncbi:unnamed protein product, partial [Prorocentrum cordatum]
MFGGVRRPGRVLPPRRLPGAPFAQGGAAPGHRPVLLRAGPGQSAGRTVCRGAPRAAVRAGGGGRGRERGTMPPGIAVGARAGRRGRAEAAAERPRRPQAARAFAPRRLPPGGRPEAGGPPAAAACGPPDDATRASDTMHVKLARAGSPRPAGCHCSCQMAVRFEEVGLVLYLVVCGKSRRRANAAFRVALVRGGTG